MLTQFGRCANLMPEAIQNLIARRIGNLMLMQFDARGNSEFGRKANWKFDANAI